LTQSDPTENHKYVQTCQFRSSTVSHQHPDGDFNGPGQEHHQGMLSWSNFCNKYQITNSCWLWISCMDSV